MQYIKVLATDSTNTSLKEYFRKNPEIENTCLLTFNQTKGKGQRGESWHTKPHKNLTFSVLLKNINLNPQAYFKLNALISLSLQQVIQQEIPKSSIYIKWPNDILAGSQKICGILIENILREKKIKHSIIGIGLNVNQIDFPDLPKAGSLKTIVKKEFDLENLLLKIVENLEQKVYENLQKPLDEILKLYENHLFRINQISTFEFPDSTHQSGIIRGVSLSGKLLIEFEDELKEVNLKEVKLLY